MRKTLILASTAIALTFFSSKVLAQSEPGKVELGGHFTSITKPNPDGSRIAGGFGGRTEAGFGGRFTFNFNRILAVEAEGNFFPHNCRDCRSENVGTLAQGFLGVKAGKRFRKFGVFGKARPGVASFSGGEADFTVLTGPPPIFPTILVDRSRANNFAFDVGGVVELYHSRRIFTRFDAGDTIIRYAQDTSNVTVFDATGAGISRPVTRPADTRHNFQFTVGIGIRF